jgi:hypothetical protein
MFRKIRRTIRFMSNIHRPGDSPNVFLFSTPRSGSTWLMELIWGQPYFKSCNEPLNLRMPLVQQYLGITEWQDLYNDSAGRLLESYFQGFCGGRLRFMNTSPRHEFYRPITRRIVFKIIHGGEDRMHWFRDRFNGRIVYLIRHPIAVSLSRELYPRLHAFLNSDYRRHFTSDQLEYAHRILDTGSKLEHGVLSWCLQNTVPLRQATADWAIVSYEQMVLDPRPVVAYLADKLELPKPERMMDRLTVPSAVKAKSDKETQSMLESGTGRRSWLVEKWRKQVNESQERRAMEILERFQLDVYGCGDLLPADRVWIRGREA